MHRFLNDMPVLPLFDIGDIVKISPNLRQGRNYGAVYCGSTTIRLAGKQVKIEGYDNGFTGKIHYRVTPVDDAIPYSRYLVSESMIVGARKKLLKNRITPDFVIQCYRSTSYSPCFRSFFSSAKEADPLGVIYLAFGGDIQTSTPTQVKRFLLRFYDPNYIIGFAVGYDGTSRWAYDNRTIAYEEGVCDGEVVRREVLHWNTIRLMEQLTLCS